MWRKALGAIIAAGLAMSGLVRPAEAQASEARYVLLAISKTDSTLAIVDPSSLAVLARIPVGPDPHEVIASPDGRFAYVSNTGGGAMHRIDVIDLVNRRALPPIDTAPLMGPHGLAHVGGRLWFTAQTSQTIGRYDPAAGRMDWLIGTGQDGTHMIHVSPDGTRITATNVGSGTVSILEHRLVEPRVPPTGVLPPGARPRMDWVHTVVPVAPGNEGFDVSPDGRELWAGSPGGTIGIIDLSTRTLTATIAAGVLGLHRLAFTPDGRHLLAVSIRTGELLVFDTRTRSEIRRLNICRGGGMMIDARGQRAFVSCTPNNTIAIIDLNRFEDIGRLDVGGRPDGMTTAVVQ